VVATGLVEGAVAGERIHRAVPLDIAGCAPPTGLSTVLPLGFLVSNSVQLYFAWLRSAKLQLHLGSLTFHKFALAPPKSLPIFSETIAGACCNTAPPRPKSETTLALQRKPAWCDADADSTLCTTRQDDSKANQDVERFFYRSWVEIELPIPFCSDATFENIVSGDLATGSQRDRNIPVTTRRLRHIFAEATRREPLPMETNSHGVFMVNISDAASHPNRRRKTAK